MTRLLRPVMFLLSIAVPGLMACAQDHEAIVRQWLHDHHGQWGLTADDVRNIEVTDSSTDKNGTGYVYIRQTVRGLPVEGAVANFAVKDGRVAGSGNRLVADAAGRAAAPVPAIGAEDALRAAAAHLGLQVADVRTEHRLSATDVLLGRCGISRDPVPARLAYRVVQGRRDLPLAWNMVIRETERPHWWHVAVDARNGMVLWEHDRVRHCTFPDAAFARGYNAMDELGAPPPAAMDGAEGAGYRVFPLPVESPVYGPRAWVADPADPAASPYGWHDTNGMPGAEYTITRGNNVYAGEDFDDDDEIGHSPDGGPSLSFDFPYDQMLGPAGYVDAAITNLFHTCNVLHDIWYHYGFDEAAGNFQHTNYTGAGAGEDEVHAQAQDGGGMNNANFATPPDGMPGTMQMYLWRTGEGDSLRVNGPASVAGEYPAVVASFGPLPPSAGITSDLVLAEDDAAPASDGCDPLLNAAALAGHIALVDRGLCTFASKVAALEAAVAVAVVVVNNVGGAPITMGGDGTTGAGIPAVMVSQANGQLLKDAMQQGPVSATVHGPGAESLRDGDLDNGIIAHEYGHGVSNRLTGGPANVDCLWNDEQMGEGWSDWMATVLTMHPGDQPATPRGMANFALGEDVGGTGLRSAPYSTDLAVNPYSYGSSNTFAFQEEHALGFLWATMLWDLTWDLVLAEGFDPDPYHGAGGNNTAMRLVMDGLKLQPCEPGFVDGRDAILLADSLDYGGAHACLIWHAFARRGLGYGADQGSPWSLFDQTEAFDVPSPCLTTGIGEPGPAVPGGFVLAPDPASGSVALKLSSPLAMEATIRLLGMDGRVLKELRYGGGLEAAIDLHGVASGLYLVQLESAGRWMQQRLVVE